MAKIDRFEDIDAWKKARTLTKAIDPESASGKLGRYFALRDQVRRAAVSIMSNISEGFERSGNRECIQFLAMAKGSAGELKSQLYVALDAEYVTKPRFDALYAQTQEISRLLAGFIRYLQTSELRGLEFKP